MFYNRYKIVSEALIIRMKTNKKIVQDRIDYFELFESIYLINKNLKEDAA